MSYLSRESISGSRIHVFKGPEKGGSTMSEDHCNYSPEREEEGPKVSL